MSDECLCSVTLNNTGTSQCPSIMEIASKLFIVPEFKNDNSQFTIPIVDLKSLTAMQLLINATNPKDRIYPLPEFQNVEDLRAETVFEDFNNGTKAEVREGIRSFAAFMIEEGTIYLGKIKTYKCQRFGVIIVDNVGNEIYKRCATDPLLAKPILVSNRSLSAILAKANDSEVEKIALTFDFRQSEKDEDLRVVPAALMDYDANNDLLGLQDVDNTQVPDIDIDVITIVTTLKDCFGCPVTGLVIGDWGSAVFNITQSSSFALSAVVENPLEAGEYTLTLTLPTTTGDSIRQDIVKDGFDFTKVALNPHTITN